MVATFRPNDPLLSSQWHLAMIGRLGFGSGNSTAGLERIWAQYNGNGIYVGIWDDGVERSHWDLDANYEASRQVTINGTLNDGQPLTNNDGHGTAVAGLIAAENNGQGGVGVAFGSDVTSIRIFGGPDDINSNWSRYLLTLDSLRNFDVTNHSYGGAPDFTVHGDVAKFQAAAALGRGGLGTVNVKSAGNSNIDGNGEALDGSRFTVTVAALGTNGNVASYSTYGSHVLVSAPAGSVTTDRLGSAAGYNGLLGGDYTNIFGGTSAAGPITAGVVTLMLDANAGLGWRDVQNILAYSAIGTGSLYAGSTANEDFAWKWNGSDNWNGGGLHYSEDYGYGMVNALNAVRMAEVWNVLYPVAAVSTNEVCVTTGSLAAGQAIADLSTLTYTFNVSQNIRLEHVSMTVTLSHTAFTDLRIRLVSPDQTSISLYNGSSGSNSTADGLFTYSFGVDGLRGELSAGAWTLQIQDVVHADAGTLHSVNFTGYGAAVTDDDVYHYTDEVLTTLSQTGQSVRGTLTDIDGGLDWIDAAAMVRNVVLYLDGGMSSTLAGATFLTIAAGTWIENAITGDGDDQIFGNELDNLVYGMRGNDALDGGLGIDTAAFFGNFSDYTVITINDVTSVANTIYGTDTLSNFEFLQFADQTIAIPSGGNPPDSTAPALTALSPSDDAHDVAVGADIVLTFDEAVTAGVGTIVIHNIDGSVWDTFDVTGPDVSISGMSVTIDPTADLAGGSSYYVNVDAGAILDLSANAFQGLFGNSAFNFETAFPPDIVAPALIALSPSDDAHDVAVGADIVLTFDEAVTAGTGAIVIHNIDGSVWRTFDVNGSDVSIGGTTVTIDPTADLAAGSSYYVNVDAGAIRDLSANAFQGLFGDSAFNFETAFTADNTAPALVALSPSDDAHDVAVDSDIVLTFDEVVTAGIGAILIYNIDGGLWGTFDVNGPAVSITGTSVTIDPTADLAAGSSYYVNVDAGAILDLSANGFQGLFGNSAFNFETAFEAGIMVGTERNDTLLGTSNDDHISGLAGNDKLIGYDGNDLLDGGTGDDTMQGGAGNDRYIVDSVKDKISEATGGGTDTVITSLKSYVLRSNLENLRFEGSLDFKGVGNKFGNVISGGDGDDILNGMAGADSLTGGEGADRFVLSVEAHSKVGTGRDVIEEFVSGVDLIDLSAIDANGIAKGLAAFDTTLVDAFTRQAGQLRVTNSGSDVIVAGDIDGNSVADFEILVRGVSSLSADDFIL